MRKNLFAFPADGQQRVVIERLTPQLDGGRWAIKAVTGDSIAVTADVFADGHDMLAVKLLSRHESDTIWTETPMFSLGNDAWAGEFSVHKQGTYEYTIEAWVDHPATWQHEVEAKVNAQVMLGVELLQGIEFLNEMAAKASKDDKKELQEAARILGNKEAYQDAVALILSPQFTEWLHRYPQRQSATRHTPLRVYADRERAAFSAWYSFFPRSAARQEGQHGTFKDAEKLLPRIHELGFDVVYLPPVHPIGQAHRKGKNNAVSCQPGEPGVPYAIGSAAGGHTAILSEFGTLADFKQLVEACKSYGMELAMDLAIQCSPDHPWVQEHPEWFKILPDGTIKYAENPPKKYQDIYPVNFETHDWQGLWNALKEVIMTWAEWGVRIIRVDNPHTKAFSFWEWVIAEVKAVYPDMIFLSEAFTRPRVMEQLAKLGFTQSYTYFTWRPTKQELMAYLTELTQTDMKHYFRPNFWPNTHDINPFQLHQPHEPMYALRLFLAATLSGNYGIFGPTYEYMYHHPNLPKEEYYNSEKYEIKYWDWEQRNKLTYIITQVNKARRENSALQRTNNIQFLDVSNDALMAYLKTHANGSRILCIANMDAYQRQNGYVHVPLHKIGKAPHEPYRVHDLISGASYIWHGETNFVDIDPQFLPFHLFRIEDIH